MISGPTGRQRVRRPVSGWGRPVWLIALLLAMASCDSQAPSASTPSRTGDEPAAASPSPEAASQAVAAWQGMWRAYADAGRSANPDASDLPRYATGSALSTLRNGLRAYATKGHVLRGELVTDPQVTQLSPPAQPTTATITDCLDDSTFLVYDRAGEPINDEPGGPRHAQGTVTKTADGWRVTSFGVQRPGTC